MHGIARFRMALMASSAVVAAVASPALAQTAPVNEPATGNATAQPAASQPQVATPQNDQAGQQVQPGSVHSSGSPKLEEIVVTGDRSGTDLVQVGSFRGARQMDTPLTISVIPKEIIQEQQAHSILDALRNTPGVTSSQTSPTVYDNLSIRGIPVDNRENYRLNGVLPIVNLIDLPLDDKARVEALKGASALYYGFTTPSGIINLTTETAPPSPLVDLYVNGNSHGQISGHIDAGNTWGIFGARVNASVGNVDSGIDNTRGNRNFESARLELKPTDTIHIALDAEHIYKKVTEPTIVQISTKATTLPKLVDPSTNPGADYFYATAEEVNLLAQASWAISPAWNLTVDAGQSRATRDRNFTRLANFDPVTGNGKLTLSAARGQVYRNRSYRAELAGTLATGPIVHELLIGVDQNKQFQYSPAGGALTSADCIRIGLNAGCVQNYYDPVPLSDWGNFDASRPYDPSRDTLLNDIGYYAFDRMKFGGPKGDMFSLLGGVRKSVYTESNKRDGQTFKATPVSVSGAVVIKPVEWASAYATYIEGLESTPPAPLTAVNAGETLGASKSKQYEAGIKIKPLPRLLFTAAYFDIQRALTYTTLANVYVKNGRATYRGFETSLTGNVTPELQVYASALLLSAKQGQTSDTTLIGNRIENTAKTTWSLFADYKLDRMVRGLQVNAGVYHVGDRAVNPQNTLFVPGYTLLSLGASYTAAIAGRSVSFRINADNVGGKRYFAATSSNYIAFGPPPTVKFTVSTELLPH